MAKLKITGKARKSVGGSAKQVILGEAAPSRLRPSSAKSRSPSVTPSAPPSTAENSPAPDSMEVDIRQKEGEGDEQPDPDGDDWCALCSDGNSLLLNCSNCGAAHCAACVPGLSRLSQEELENSTFRCLRCAPRGKVFHGLYDDERKPIYPEGIEVAAHNIGASVKNRLRTPRLLIIEFVLRELSDTGTAGQMLYLSLAPNYVEGKKGFLHHLKISFDLNNEQAIKKHRSDMRSHLSKIKKSGCGYDHAVVIVHTHSDDTRGDLFYTSKDDKEGGPLATPIDSFFDNVVGKEMKAHLQKMKFSALFVLACGSVVRNGVARSDLEKVADSFNFTDTFAFGAPKVIGHYVTIWMIKYADMVIVAGMQTDLSISSLLYSSDIGRHTSVLFIHNAEATEESPRKLLTGLYIWEHQEQRPNTHTFPLTCSICRSLQPWQRPGAFFNNEGNPFTLKCTGKIGNKKCHGSIKIEARPPSTLLESPYVGRWYSYDNPATR